MGFDIPKLKQKFLIKYPSLINVYDWWTKLKNIMILENKARIWKISLEFVIFLSVQIILIGIGDDSFAVWIFIIIFLELLKHTAESLCLSKIYPKNSEIVLYIN